MTSRPPAPGKRAARAAAAGLLAAAAAAALLLTLAAGPGRAPARPAVTLAALSGPALPAGHAGPSSVAPSRPPSPSPSPAPSPAPAPVPGGGAGCGLLDVSCEITTAMTSFAAGLARAVLHPVLGLIGETLLSSPQAGSLPAVRDMWDGSAAIADAAYALLVLAGGIIVMSHETLQTSWAAKDIAPRLVTGFLTANLSLPLISRAVALANGLSAAIAGRGVTPAAASRALGGALDSAAQSGSVFLVLLGLAGGLLGLALVVVYVLRLMALVLLTAAAPLFLAAWALPQTEWAARWWWRALFAALSVQAAQALVLAAAVRVFAAAGWLNLAGAAPGLLPVITAVCLIYILMRIPFWVTRPVLSPLGRSPLHRTARFVLTTAVLSRVTPLLRAGPALTGRGRPRPGGRGGTRRPAGGRPGPGGPARPRPGTGHGSTGAGAGRPGGAAPAGSGAPGRPGAGPTGPGGPNGGPGSRPGPGAPAAPAPARRGGPPPRPAAGAAPAARPGTRPPSRPRPGPATSGAGGPGPRPAPRAAPPAAPRPPGGRSPAHPAGGPSPRPPGPPARRAPAGTAGWPGPAPRPPRTGR
jgi:hypothetical protein